MSHRRWGAAPLILLLPFGLNGCPVPAAQGTGEQREQPPLTVRTEKVSRGTLRQQLRLPAELFARQSVELAFPFSGRIKRIAVELGDQVEANSLVAQLDDGPLRVKVAEARAASAVAQAAVKRAQAEFRSIVAEFGRTAPLAVKQLVTPQEMDQLQSRRDAAEAALEVAQAQAQQAEAQLRVIQQQISDARLLAPFSGAIQERLVEPGAVVGPNVPVLRLVHSQPAVARFQVSELHLRRLRPASSSAGQDGPEAAAKAIDVELQVPAYPNRSWQGRLARLGPALDPANRAVTAEAEFDNAAGDLMPGMYGHVTIDLGGRTEALRLPLKAIVELDALNHPSPTATTASLKGTKAETRPGVFVIVDGRAQARPVTLGLTDGAYAEVLEGVAEDEAVVVEGQHTLGEGRTVRAAPLAPTAAQADRTDGRTTP